MPDATAVTTPANLQAIANAALVNLAKKAQRGDTLTAADWRELRRMIDQADGASALPWIHPSEDALATALGVTTRTLQNWRGKKCPVPSDGPWDELAVRLWVLRGKARATLADPAAGPLADYLAQVQPLAAASQRTRKGKAKDLDEEKRGILRRQGRKLDVQIRSAEKQHLAQARALCARLLGQAEQALLRDLTGLAGETLWQLAQGTKVQAAPRLDAHLRAAVDRAMAGILDGAPSQPTGSPP